MSQLFTPDFIKNRVLQLVFALSTMFDLFVSGTIKHILIMLGLPYATSIALYYLMSPKKIPVKPKVSEQYRPQKPHPG